MKNLLLIVLIPITFSSLDAQIMYKDFGSDGWRIAYHENTPFDIDEDGLVDLHINEYPGELGFSAELGVGCIAYDLDNVTTPFGAYTMKVFEEGELILMNPDNSTDYIEDDRASIYHFDGLFAEGWKDKEPQYIGFASLPSVVSTGKDIWAKVAVDVEKGELIVYEYAYVVQTGLSDTGIKAGSRGTTSINDISDQLSQLQIGPNPASDRVNITLDYRGDEALQLQVLDITGKVVLQHREEIPMGQNEFSINTEELINGTYLLQFINQTGSHTIQLQISK